MAINEDKYIKKLICERYENCFQCPLGKDSTDNEGNLINICTYESDTIKTIAKDFVNKCNSNKSLCCNLKLGYDDCCECKIFQMYLNGYIDGRLTIRTK